MKPLEDDLDIDILSYSLFGKNVNPHPSAAWFVGAREEEIAEWQQGDKELEAILMDRVQVNKAVQNYSYSQMEEECGERHRVEGLDIHYDLDRIRAVPIEIFTLHEVKRNGRYKKVRCLMHADTHPSCVLYPQGYHCFVCHKGGSAIDWCELEFGMNFREACEFLNGYI